MSEWRTAFAVLGAVVAVAAGCTSDVKLREAELAQLASMLPGRYDNLAQHRADVAAGRLPHEAIALSIVPAYAPFLGDHVFYLHETDADDPRRVTGQRLLVLAVVGKEGRIVQRGMTLADPPRWRDGDRNPDLFTSLMPQDLGAAAGCTIEWRREADGFVADNASAPCRRTAAADGAPISVESRAELTPDGIAMGDRAVDASGRVVQGHPDDALYRFRRRAGS